MIARRKRTMVLLLAMVLLAAVASACNDWDGMDRDGWEAQYGPPTREPLPTPQATPPGVREGDEKLWLEIWGEALAEAE
jgi:predicted small secreted protein